MCRLRLPDFLVIGAMKCATTTLHQQLARQPGVFMSDPKEPNFFSDDDVHALGLDWYASLFEGAAPDDLRGESSTHYTKLPTHPRTIGRMSGVLRDPKLIYIMRHPIDRLESHYFHELTVGRIATGIEEAVRELPALVEYGRYSGQLQPYLDVYGPGAILPVFFDHLTLRPQAELERIGRFLGCRRPLRWDHDLAPQNAGRHRLRHSTWRETLVQSPILTGVRRRLLPRTVSESVKALWRVKVEPPQVSSALRDQLSDLFDEDLSRLGGWLGIPLNCRNFREVTRGTPCDWAGTPTGRTWRWHSTPSLAPSGRSTSPGQDSLA